jgi:hypothetical protein
MKKQSVAITLILTILVIFSLGCGMLKGGVINKGTDAKEAMNMALTKLKEKNGFVVSTKLETADNNVKDKNVFVTVTHFVAPDKESNTSDVGNLRKEEIQDGKSSISCSYIPPTVCEQCCTETKKDKPYYIWDNLILRTSFDASKNAFIFKGEESLNGKNAIVYKSGDDKEGKEAWLSSETGLPLQAIDFHTSGSHLTVYTSTFDYETPTKIPNHKEGEKK